MGDMEHAGKAHPGRQTPRPEFADSISIGTENWNKGTAQIAAKICSKSFDFSWGPSGRSRSLESLFGAETGRRPRHGFDPSRSSVATIQPGGRSDLDGGL